ncbi:MAG TPA: (2Fe-2S)-binding protein [Actinocatenispora sp.]
MTSDGDSPRRVTDDPVEPTAEPVERITVDGTAVPLRPGETLAAAMLASGRTSWRRTRFGGRPRGVYCGIGVCYDCLVTVNGVPGIRACRYTARPGDAVTTGPAEPVLDGAPQ